jgi:trimeric autotransporter adhesin
MKNLKTQFTVLVLSTICLLTGAFGQLTPIGDSYINTAAPTTNYGAKTTLDVESTQTTFIQFNLSSIPSGYTSADITKATLKLFVDGVTKAGSFNVDYVNGTWTESTIDASNAPALGTTIQASVPITSADKDQYILVDVTAAVQAWLSGTPNDGIALVANSPLDATFDSKEATKTSHTAELDIVFAGGGTLTGITTASGSGLTGGGTSGTLNLSLTNVCAANQVLQYNGSSWACAAVGTGTITGVTAGTDLTGGGTSGNVTLNLNTAATNALYAQLGATNTFTTNQTVDGTLTANSGFFGVVGNTSYSGSGAYYAGVLGQSTASTGSGAGAWGLSSSTSGIAVGGQALAASGNTLGVYGTANSTAGVGVWGQDVANTGNTVGVFGFAVSPTGEGVYGENLSGTGGAPGVYGLSTSTAGAGVQGTSTASTGSTFGVFGQASSPGGWGVAGESPFAGVVGYNNGEYDISVLGAPYGVVGSTATAVGVYGASSGVSVIGDSVSPHAAGVWGDYGGGDGFGVLGTADQNWAGGFYNNGPEPTLIAENETATAGGEVFQASIPNLLGNAFATIGDAGCGTGFMALQLGQLGLFGGCNNYTLMGDLGGNTYLNAGSGGFISFRIANGHSQMTITNDNVDVLGTLTKPAGSFKIDHPLDPANKYLYHSFVESPDMKNMYDGTITTDDAGLATVTLPNWFQTLNRDFRYQLTVIGQFAQAIVASEISGNQFGIRTDKPNVKVSWQVTGTRQDAYANAHRIQVEVEKAPADRGHYLYPELVGAPETARIGYMAPAPGSEQIVHHQRPSLHSGNASPAHGITLTGPRQVVPPKVAPLPHTAPLLHKSAQASKLEVNQK